jgi:hypothetical protein
MGFWSLQSVAKSPYICGFRTTDVAYRCCLLHRTSVDAKVLWLEVGKGMGGLLREGQGCIEAPRGPKDLSVALSTPMTASPLAAYVGEASSLPRA